MIFRQSVHPIVDSLLLSVRLLAGCRISLLIRWYTFDKYLLIRARIFRMPVRTGTRRLCSRVRQSLTGYRFWAPVVRHSDGAGLKEDTASFGRLLLRHPCRHPR